MKTFDILYSVFNKYNFKEIDHMLKSTQYEEEIIELINNMNMDRFITNTRINESIGEKGSKLSGGEKQRLCIMRCLIQNKNIILADEPFSALDSVTEKSISKYLYRDRTSLVISHNNEYQYMYDNIIDLTKKNEKSII